MGEKRKETITNSGGDISRRRSCRRAIGRASIVGGRVERILEGEEVLFDLGILRNEGRKEGIPNFINYTHFLVTE